MKNEPKIRIKGFEGEWKETKLGNVTTDSSYGIAASAIPYDGCHKYIRITDIDDSMHTFKPNPLVSPSYYNEFYVVKEDDILFARTGASVGKTYLYHPKDGELYYAGYLIKMHIEDADSEFIHLQTLLQKYNNWIISESQRSGQPGINLLQLQNYSFNSPALPEQHAIATYFHHLDTLIETVDKKLASLKQVKEASLQTMFPQEGQSVPKVRFKGFEGEWKTVQLSNCLDVSKERNTENKYGIDDVLSVSDDNGVTNQIELLGRSFAGKSVSNYGILHEGEIVYTKSPLKSKPFGIIKKNNYKTGIVSVLYAIYKPHEDISSDYIHYYFSPAWRLNNYIHPLVNKGAKNTMNISDETALMGYIPLPPTLSEQCKLASFFVHLDKQIELVQHRLELLRRIKMLPHEK